MEPNCDSWATVNFGEGQIRILCTRRKNHEGHHNTHVVWTDTKEAEFRE